MEFHSRLSEKETIVSSKMEWCEHNQIASECEKCILKEDAEAILKNSPFGDSGSLSGGKDNDYILKEDETSCWITVGEISVYVRRLYNGAVAVELLPLGDEEGKVIDSCYGEIHEDDNSS